MFKTMKIGTRLTLGFGAVLVLFTFAIATTSIFLKNVHTSAKQVEDETLPYLMKAYEMNLAATDVSEVLTDVAATHNLEGLKEAENSAADFRKNVAAFKEMFKRENDIKAMTEIDELESAFNSFYEGGKHMASVYVSQGMKAGNELMTQHDKKHEELVTDIEKLQKSHVDEANSNTKQIVDASNRVNQVLYTMGLFAGIIGVIMAFFITRSVTKVLREVKSVADNVAAASQELSSSSEELSQGSTEQASSVEETTSSLEEMSANITAEHGQFAPDGKDRCQGIE